MSVEIVASLYGASLCLFMPSVSSMLMAVVNLVNLFKLLCNSETQTSIKIFSKVSIHSTQSGNIAVMYSKFIPP